MVVQQGVVGGAAVAHHALNQILQQTQVVLTNMIKVTALKFQKRHIHTHLFVVERFGTNGEAAQLCRLLEA